MNLRDVNTRVLVPDKINVGNGQVFADELSSGVTGFVIPFVFTVKKNFRSLKDYQEREKDYIYFSFC